QARQRRGAAQRARHRPAGSRRPLSAGRQRGAHGRRAQLLYGGRLLAETAAAQRAVFDQACRQLGKALAEKGCYALRMRFAPLAILAAAAGWLALRWDTLPERWVVHWGPGGVPDGYASKTVSGVFGPLLFGVALAL